MYMDPALPGFFWDGSECPCGDPRGLTAYGKLLRMAGLNASFRGKCFHERQRAK